MAFGIVIEMPGVTAETYDAVNEKLDLENDLPNGLILHTAGLGPNGVWRIFDVWESGEAFARFEEGRLRSALGDPIYQLHNIIKA